MSKTEEAADLSAFTLRHLSYEQWLDVKNLMLQDPWVFCSLIMQDDDKGIPRFHAPMLYLLTGSTALLVRCLDHPDYQSAMTLTIRTELARRGIDYHTRDGITAMNALLVDGGVNLRVSRSMGKSSYAKGAILWAATKDPNLDIAITSKSNDAAWELCAAIGEVVRSERYGHPERGFFNERVPKKKIDELVTKERIWLDGRTKGEQWTIEARGIGSQWAMRHYNLVWPDDIVARDTEKAEASKETAINWIAGRRGISKPRILGGTRFMFTGTIYGCDDDNSVLVTDETIFSIRVPIWLRAMPATLDTLMEDGVPVLPEWYPVEDIRKMRAQTLSAKEEGPVSWLQNFELSAHEDGLQMFTTEMLERVTLKVGTGTRGKEILARPNDPNVAPVGEPDSTWHVFDPRAIDIAIGVDQSVAEGRTADQWCVFVAGQDSTGHRYLLDMAVGKGYEYMLIAIPAMWNEWGRPSSLGMDTSSSQVITLEWMKRSPDFQAMASVIKKVTSANISKEMRLLNYLAAGFRSKTLWIHPRLTAFKRQAVRFRAGSRSAAVDDMLDAAAIALEVLTGSVYDSKELDELEFRTQHATEGTQVHDGLGSDNWLDVLGFD